jgi:hypothetical protein
MTGFFEKKTPARGGTRPGRKHHYAKAVDGNKIPHKPDDEIALYHFQLAEWGQAFREVTVPAPEARVLRALAEAKARSVGVSLACVEVQLADLPFWVPAVHTLREDYGLPIVEWHCKGGGGAQKGNKLYALNKMSVRICAVTKHTRAELAAFATREGGAA